jgi:hypothetical protein
MAHEPSQGFSADWLRLREPLDLAARSQALALGFRESLVQATGDTPHPPWRLIDLAAGTGANFRAMAPVLAGDQHWILIDHDPALLAAQRREIAAWAQQQGWPCLDDGPWLRVDTGTAQWRVRGQALDLARDLECLDLDACDGLLTTAFLDLVSADWLDRLCALLAATPRPLLATLSVAGERRWQPPRPADALISEAFLTHQGGDKGFGDSLGVHAVPHLAVRLRPAGFNVSTDDSHWRVDGRYPELLETLATEAAQVTAQVEPAMAADVAGWLEQRSADLAAGVLSLQVGHVDLLARPG